MKKKSVNIIIGVLIVLNFYGCANMKNATAINGIKYQNKKLEKENAPIRFKYKEYDSGIVYNPYLIGVIAPTVADPLLIKDTLNTIKIETKDKKSSLVQTRFVTRNEAPTSIKEVWVVKNAKDEMHAYLVNFVVSPVGGTDTYIHGGNIVFHEMLEK